jgi:hypothetical protein
MCAKILGHPPNRRPKKNSLYPEIRSSVMKTSSVLGFKAKGYMGISLDLIVVAIKIAIGQDSGSDWLNTAG